MMHFKFIYLIFNFFLISFYTFSNEKIEVSVYNKNITFNVEVAKTIEERRTGLMYRKKLLNNEGMLFIFPREKIIQLWMKNTYIPLDVIFISENKVIVDIKKNMEKLSETIVKSKVKSRYALEFNAGLINKLDIEIGDKVLFNE
tara:strand:- start:148 stop:579 length:432 start_codon:yes stop_codon:yes gene_type:complete